MKTAEDIAEHLLGQTGAALKSGDFEMFVACFHIPNTVGTFDGVRTIATVEDMRATFDQIRAYFKAQGVTDLVRDCRAAVFKDDETLHTSHVSQVLSGTTLVQKPYPAFSIVRLIDGNWKITHSEYAIIDAPDQNAAFWPR